MLKINRSGIATAITSVALAAGLGITQAAPLPDGTLLTLDPGVVDITGCASGSCFGMAVPSEPYLIDWTALEGGTDGGLIIGKDQLSGGQEIIGSGTSNTTPGELTNAWNFFRIDGTLFTAPDGGALNVFDDANCSFESCVGLTELRVLNGAWKESVMTLGNLNGCQSIVCNSNEQAGWNVIDWKINIDPDTGIGSYYLHYSNVVPDGDPSGLGNVLFQIILTGNVVLPTASDCKFQHPLKQVTTTGGGQGTVVNATVQTTFTGYITTETGLTSGGKNSVKVCPDTTVDYETTSSVGLATCSINGVAVAASGTVAIGDRLICTNKPDGSDTDRFSIKSGL